MRTTTRGLASVLASALVSVLMALALVLVTAPALVAPAQAAPAAVDAAERSGSPRRLVVPAIGVDAGIIPVGATRAGHLAIGRSVRGVYRTRIIVRAKKLPRR